MAKRIILILLFTILLFSCSDNSTDPESEEIFGTYKLKEMSREGVNFYDVGLRLSLELMSDSSFSGNMFVPDTLGLLEEDSQGDQTILFEGRFKVESDNLTFSTDTDIYIRDADWSIDGNNIYTNDFAYTLLVKE